ncbi:MAG: hypothetical protein RLZZ301_87 [Bacteroidota bacterium]|jgi:hypothetical protein
MKKLAFLFLFGLSTQVILAQSPLKNTLSTSVLRLESNSQTMTNRFKLKTISGVEYQRNVQKWNFGVKYEHGFNKINDESDNCNDCYYGTGYMREDNFYLTSNYTVFNLFQSRLKLNAGLGLYYSNLNYSGFFSGGWSGTGIAINSTYNTIGFTPSLSLSYYPTQRIVVSLHSMARYGWGSKWNAPTSTTYKSGEYVVTAPELRIGLRF